MFDFTGHDIGPMFVHKAYPDSHGWGMRGNWTVTHTQTGYSVHKGIPSRARADRLARQLAKLPCWDFSDVEACKEATKDHIQIIRSLRQFA